MLISLYRNFSLVALRIEFEEHGADREAMQVFTPAKVQELRALLDAAIGGTKRLVDQKHDGVSFYPAYASRSGIELGR
jgi:hypothetical protein